MSGKNQRKMTKEQLEWIMRNMKNEEIAPMLEGFVPNPQLIPQMKPPQYAIDPELEREEYDKKHKALMKMKELQEDFDMKHIEEMFDEGVKCGAIPNDRTQFLQYPFGKYVYELRRFRKV